MTGLTKLYGVEFTALFWLHQFKEQALYFWPFTRS